jgi:hypothetical protein
MNKESVEGADALLLFADGREEHMMVPYPLPSTLKAHVKREPAVTEPSISLSVFGLKVPEITLYRTPDSPDEAPVYKENVCQ